MADATLLLATLLDGPAPGPSAVLAVGVLLLVVVLVLAGILARDITRRDAPLGREALLERLLADRSSFDAYFAVHGFRILSAASERRAAAAQLSAHLGLHPPPQVLVPIAVVAGGEGLLCRWEGNPERQGPDAPILIIDADGQWQLLATSLAVLVQRLTVPVRLLPGPPFVEDVDWCMAEMSSPSAPWEVHYRRFRQWAEQQGLHAPLGMVAAVSSGLPCRGAGADVCEAGIAAWWAALILDASALP